VLVGLFVSLSVRLSTCLESTVITRVLQVRLVTLIVSLTQGYRLELL